MKMEKVVIVSLVLCICLFREGHSQECVNGLVSTERVRQLGRVAGKLKSDRKEQQRIIPDITFTCSGTVSEWIIAAEWKGGPMEVNFPEMQVWRETATGSGVYTKIHVTTMSVSEENTEIYHYTIDTIDVQPGDVLGMFEPDKSKLELYYTDTYGPVNYYTSTGKDVIVPPDGNFDINAGGMTVKTQYDLPLLTVTIVPSDGSSASDCISSFATMDAIMIGLQQSIQDENKQQRLIPGITFTCHGFITKWILAAKWGDEDNYPELQTWNSTDGITYTKQGATTFSFDGGSAEMTFYEYTPDTPHEFHDGDVLGMFIPDKSRYKIFFQADESGPTNYYYDTGKDTISPEDPFTTTGEDTEDVHPLVAVEVSIPQPAVSTSTSATGLVQMVSTQLLNPDMTSTVQSTAETASIMSSDVGLSTTEALSQMPSSSSVTSPTQSTGQASSSIPIADVSTTEIMQLTSTILVAPSPSGASVPDLTGSTGESSSSDASGAIAGTVVGVLIVLVLAGIIGLTVAVIVVRRRNKEYSVQQRARSDGITNPVYDGASGKLGKDRGSIVKEPWYETTAMAVYEDVEAAEYTEPTTSRSDTLTQSYCVPTEEQRKTFGNSQDIYASISVASYTNEESYFQESEIYWAPASNQSELYAQLASNRFREIPRPLIRIAEQLGTGNFGLVSKGVWETPGGGMEVAVKMLRPTASETEKVKFLQEAAIMGQFHHPNVITLHGVVTLVEPVMIVLELMPNGDLRQYLMKLQPIPGEMLLSNTNQMCLDFCCQIASGMEYLSKKAFVHRDLAARNVLVSDQRTCKISDFGMARDLEEENYYVSHGGQIPVKWTAPEAINFKKYSTASDVWSYGAILYEIWSLGHKPFRGYTNVQTVSLVNGGWRLPPPPGCPRAVYKLMIHCWHPETRSRPSFSDLLQSLSRPETELLNWTEEDTKTHPQATVLGGSLDAGTGLYTDLQIVYVKNK